MSIAPPHTIAIDEALAEMWKRHIPRFSFVPADGGFVVVVDGNVVFESPALHYAIIEEHYIGCVKLYSPYWRNNPKELPNQKYQWAFRMMVPDRFLDVFIQRGTRRIDFVFYIPLDLAKG